MEKIGDIYLAERSQSTLFMFNSLKSKFRRIELMIALKVNVTF